MLEKVYAFVKQLDPHHPMTMAFCCCDPLTYKDAFDIGMSAQQSNPCRFLRCERLHKQPVSLMLNGSLFGSGSVPNHFHRRRSGG